MLNVNKIFALTFTLGIAQHTLAGYSDEISYFEFLEKRDVPKEVTTLIPVNEKLLDFNFGHLNDDVLWDLALITVPSDEFNLAQQENRLPKKRTLNLYLGDGQTFKLKLQHQYAFKNLDEKAILSIWQTGILDTENHHIHPKVRKIYDLLDPDAPFQQATGGFTLSQSFENYSYSIKFIWDKKLQDWIYAGALGTTHSNPQLDATSEDESSVTAATKVASYETSSNYVLLLKENPEIKALKDFYFDHPEYEDSYSFDPDNYGPPE